ncbi:MAG: glucosaminidase domain-containing protein [Treponema sp.]|nr:glucosaminidase domain-containing protein [Treponema sp.]
MKVNLFSILLSILVISFGISCAGLPSETIVEKTEPAVYMFEQEINAPEISLIRYEFIYETEPEIVKPELPTYIMGNGMVSVDKMSLFLQQNNPRLDHDYVLMLMEFYIEEAAFEGVNHDIAFVQMCLETGYLRYGGDVKPEQNNFCGLGAIGNGEPGHSFPDPRTGVRAHIQHLKAYGSEEPLNSELVSPRFGFVRRGSSPTYEGLAGTWAADRQYAVKIKSILERLYDFAF